FTPERFSENEDVFDTLFSAVKRDLETKMFPSFTRATRGRLNVDFPTMEELAEVDESRQALELARLESARAFSDAAFDRLSRSDTFRLQYSPEELKAYNELVDEKRRLAEELSSGGVLGRTRARALNYSAKFANV